MSVKVKYLNIDRVAPNRQLVVARELTKLFETVYRGTAREIIGTMPISEIKGEFVIVLSSK